ncbi:MAG: serine/threonine protein kinase [Myxococcota bacterium]
MSKAFFALTPDRVLSAVGAHGFEPTGHIMALHCLENRVYDLKLENGRHVIAKFYRPGRWSSAAIREEHTFLLDLSDTEIPVAAPFMLQGQESLAEADGIWFAVWPRVGGRSPDELNNDELEVLGRLLARTHNVGEGKPMAARPSLTSMRFVDASLDELERWLPYEMTTRYRAAAETIADIYDDLSEGVPWFRIHGDCHRGNLLRGPDGFVLLDFDDSLTGPAVQDLWLLIGDRGHAGERQMDAFLKGYRQFRSFESSWLRLVEPLRAMRMLSFSAWIARRWMDPAFPRHFPDFGSDAYWQSELRSLEEQVERCEASVRP